AVDRIAVVAVEAVAVVDVHPQAEVVTHAAEAQLADGRAHLRPRPLDHDGVAKIVPAEARRLLRLREEDPGIALVSLAESEAAPRRGPEDEVVEDVDLGADPHLLADVERGVDPQPHVGPG